MSEKLQESAPKESEQTLAEVNASQSTAASPTSAGNTDGESPDEEYQSFSETLKELRAKQKALESKMQSAKDKGISDLRKELKELREGFVLLSQQSREGSAPASRGNAEQDAAMSDVQKMFVEAGLAADVNAVLNTPEFLQFHQLHGGNVDAIKAFKYIDSVRKQPKPVSGAVGAVQQPGSPVSNEIDENGLMADYKKELAGARGPDAVSNLKKKYRDKGLKNLW